MFSGCTVSYSKEAELGSSNQEAFASGYKNSRVVIVPCYAWKQVPTAISGGVHISEVPRCCLFLQISSQWESQKLLRGLVSHELTAYLSVFDVFLTQRIITILPKVCEPDNVESHDPLKLGFENIWILFSNFVECESLLESALWKTNLGDWVDSGNFSERGYLPLNQKNSTTHMHGLAWSSFERRTYPFAQDLSLENSADSYVYFEMTLHRVLLLFPLSITFFAFMLGFWYYFI